MPPRRGGVPVRKHQVAGGQTFFFNEKGLLQRLDDMAANPRGEARIITA
jgi:hypothetical protein